MTDADHRQTRRMGITMMVLAWLVVGALLVAYFSGMLERQRNPNRGTNVSSSGEVILERNSAGQYIAPGHINGEPVRFLVDTGASDVVVPAHLADRLQLQSGLSGRAITAGGDVKVYRAVADSVQIGGIRLDNVPAIINPHMRDDTVLLGMSFMRDLEIVQRNKTLTIRHEE